MTPDRRRLEGAFRIRKIEGVHPARRTAPDASLVLVAFVAGLVVMVFAWEVAGLAAMVL